MPTVPSLPLPTRTQFFWIWPKNLVRSAQISLPREKAAARVGDVDGEETVSFASLVLFFAER